MPGALLLFGCGKLLQHPQWLDDYLANLLMVGCLLGGLRISYYCSRRLRFIKHHIVTLVVFESVRKLNCSCFYRVMFNRAQLCCSKSSVRLSVTLLIMWFRIF